MKQTISTLALCFVSILLLAQSAIQEEESVPQSPFGELAWEAVQERIAVPQQARLELRAGELQRAKHFIISVWNSTLQDFQNDTKIAYSYGETDRILEATAYYWNELQSEWILRDKFVYFYDEQGLLFKDQFWQTNPDTQVFEVDSEWYYEYDANANLINLVIKNWNASINASLPVERMTYTYNAENQLTSESSYIWQGTWVPQEREERFYDSNGNTTRNIWSTWEENAWDIYYFGDHSFDENNYRYFSVFSAPRVLVDSIIDVPYAQITYSYDEFYNLKEELLERWSNSNDDWYIRYKIYYKYDEDNRRTQRLYVSNWSNSLQDWRFANRITYGYDEFGNQIDYTYTRMGSYNNWTNEEKKVYTYNTAVEAANTLAPSAYDDVLKQHQLVEVITYGPDAAGEFELQSKATIYYETLATNTTEYAGAGVKVYPNPATDVLQFEQEIAATALVELWDMQGKKVKSQYIEKQGRLSITELPAGLYAYTMVHQEQIYTGKIMVH